MTSSDPAVSDPDEAAPGGPVPRLGPHVPSDWWRTLFDETYLFTDADVLTPAITAREVDHLLDHTGLGTDDVVLDLCCGHGRHALELARRGFRKISGLDQSEYLLEVARSSARNEGIDIPFALGDARDLPFGAASFDAVLLLGNSFGYFEKEEDDRRVLNEVSRILRPGGRVVLDLTDGDHTRASFHPRSWEWVGDHHLVCRERELVDGRRLVVREIVVDIRRGIEEDRFYAERLYGRRQILEVLDASGFRGATIIPMKGESSRGDDLGLMQHRFLVTACSASSPQTRLATGNGQMSPSKPSSDRDGSRKASKEVQAMLSKSPSWFVRSGPPPGRGGSPRRFVAVLLGDPRLPDETKLGGIFDDDDFEVLERLRAALSELDLYEFMYLDEHDRLLENLRIFGPSVDLVFNLCDEGLRNVPRQELHVPAVLELLNLSYTGAGPQCLAHCYDKSIVRGVASEMGIRVARGFYLSSEAVLQTVLRAADTDLSYPVIVKPNAADNSMGMTNRCIARNRDELRAAVASVWDQVGNTRPLLIEEFLTGADLTYGVIGNPASGFLSLPISQDDYSSLPEGSPPFSGYEAKWVPESPYWTDVTAVPAQLPEAVAGRIRRDSHRLFARLECRDYARFDWRLDARGIPHLLEVNPNPGWSWDSHLVEAAAFAGMSYASVLASILEAAYQRLSVRTE
ncbi:D-alanine--D-alanine ligase [Longibacter salinarum]|uniref:D-alanine--D-alanine ligase n=1 Tax=Longibacter salinarum TaxID=1850348 RepID=A0A2A8D2D5_9BACT|nr:methyltransferase domain-containing protein [Longibacter salinarum]PEN14798.1 D-alanine--D-alanine ligase [Longibacter salinarum]